MMGRAGMAGPEMHRARSFQFFSRPGSSPEFSQSSSKVKLLIDDPTYDNAKLKGSARSRVLAWLQPGRMLQQLARRSQLALLFVVVCLWGLYGQASYQVSWLISVFLHAPT
jgi:hypothetical protein